MNTNNPFHPSPDDTLELSATSTTSRVTLAPGNGANVRIVAPAANDVVFIQFGGSTVEATEAKMPILPGTIEIFDVPPGAQYVAGICASTETGTLYLTVGQGV